MIKVYSRKGSNDEIRRGDSVRVGRDVGTVTFGTRWFFVMTVLN